jgi:uncharacterized protein (TIGR03067 family)
MTRNWVLAAAAAVAVAAAPAGGQTVTPTGQKDQSSGQKVDANKMLQGTYSIVSGERAGKPIPKEQIDGSMIQITDKAIVGTDKDKKEFYASTYTLDASKSPTVITMTLTAEGDSRDRGEKKDAEKGKADQSTDAQKTAVGLIKLDGDTVTLVYALPGGQPPTEFKAGENQQMFVLKRNERK